MEVLNLNKKLYLMILALSLIGLFSFTKTTAQAAGYQIVSNQAASRIEPLHNANPQSHYMWNLSHTVKLHNLKNFPNTTWTLKRVAILSHNGKKAVYFNVTDRTGQFNGWVWHGFLEFGPYQYHEDPNADGLNLIDPANNAANSMLSNYVLKKLFNDGYRGQNDLMKLAYYYGDQRASNATISFKDAVATKSLTINADNLVGMFEYPVSDIVNLIDPATKDMLLEKTGNGELGNNITLQIENFLKSNQSNQFGLWLNLSGSISNGTLALDLTCISTK